ncbi:Putative ubiquitin specific protease domain, papain-like cysteine peptidase superfamily [Septoria linicola]|uniref:ubiquitinyl hydrolase 1 n=1 Tax=Septoria linicola TaxID=215465 RepID=A0A9Q9AX46_9PEZI|nr:Putative ubiquitin specific protease domain, papain-like cysteine peptidase superfamily [Septoria linicola]
MSTAARAKARTRVHYDNERVKLARAEAALRDSRRSQRENRGAAAAGLVKRGGRTIASGRIVNPEFVKTGKIEKTFPTKDLLLLRSATSKGFSNIMAWRCYWNSMLQVFLHAPPVYSLLGNFHRDCGRAVTHCFPCALQQLAQDYWNPGPGAVVTTADIHNANRRAIPPTDPNLGDYHQAAQNDSGDSMQFVVRQLDSVSNNAQRTSADKVFYFHSRQHMICVVCGTRQDWNMNWNRLGFSLDLLQPAGDDPSIEDFIRLGEIQERNRFTCDSDECDQRRKDNPDQEKPMQTRITTLYYCPDVLIIQLSRFANSTGGKIMTDHDFSELIDLGPYTPTPDTPVLCRFSGLVAHGGATFKSGHYISVVRNPDQSFRIINDSQMYSSDDFEQDVMLPDWIGRRFQPYVLFYTKC